MATVSIVIPVYNAEKYLHEAIDSVLAQTFGDWQLVLVDDGSTDSSSEICDLYAEKDSRIEVVHVKNGGVSRARNIGINQSISQYITFIDADDILHHRALEYLVNTIELNDCGIAGVESTSDEHQISKATENFSVSILPSETATEQTLYQTSKLDCSVWGKLYKRSLFKNNHFSEGERYEDLDIFYRLCLSADKVALINTELYFYRQHSESFVHKWDHRRLDVLTVVNRMENYIAEHHPNLLPAAKDRKLSANFNMFNLAVQHGEDEVANKCWSVIKKYRWEDFKNPKIRLKNRIGILASYLGRTIYSFIAKFC